MLADGVDFQNGSAASYKSAVELLDFGQSSRRQEGSFHERGAAAREKHDHHRLRSGIADKFKGGFAGEEAVFIRFGVAAQKVLEARLVRGRSARCGYDTAQLCAARQAGQEAIEHAVSGFADGEDTDVRETAKVVATLGTAQMVAGAGQTAFDGCARINGCEGAA